MIVKKYLEYSDEKSDKFWEIEIEGSSITMRYGRMGADGTSSTKEFETEEIAQKEFEKRVKSKTSKGYQEIDVNGFQKTSKGKTNEEKYFTKKQLSNEDVLHYIQELKEDAQDNFYTIDELVRTYAVKPLNAILFTLTEGKPIVPDDMFNEYRFTDTEKKKILKFLPDKNAIKKKIKPVDKKLIKKLKQQILDTAKELSLAEAFKRLEGKNIFKKIYDDNSHASALYYEGDLNIAQLNLDDLEIGCLIVDGNLNVENSIAINETSPCLFVTGNVNAKSIFTAGGIVVGGDLILRDSLVGDYNDSGTFVFGKLEACFVFTNDYFFEFYGDVNAKYVVSDVSYELALGTKVTKCNDMLLSDFFKLLHPSFLKSIDTKSTVFLNSPVVKALVHYFDVPSLYRYISQGNTLFNE